MLPGGKAVIYTIGTVGDWDDANIVAQTIGTDKRSVLVQGGTNPHYLASGHLIYARRGAIFAVRFDPIALNVVGTPTRILENVLESSDGGAQLTVSASGTAVYVAGALASDQRRLVSVDRSGRSIPLAAPPQPYAEPRLSPDGRSLLFKIGRASCRERV